MTDNDSNKLAEAEEVRRQQQSAADLIRGKLNNLYSEEPNAKEEIAEVKTLPEKQLSKHQKYMSDLSGSGRSLAEIQVAWHEYYTNLPDAEKHEVWQEFYSEHEQAKQREKHREPKPAVKNVHTAKPVIPISNNTAATKRKASAARRKRTLDTRTANDVRQHLISQVKGRAEIHKNPHFRSLVFGISMGALTLFVLLFGFFNERFITPFIRPNTNVGATPIIIDPESGGPVGPESKIIIPKINVEAPVVYDIPSIDEKEVQKGLENGVVHYVTTPNPGEKGNAVIFGHSSSNILNKGKYKFAFLMLKSLNKDDTFIVQKDGKRYVYKIYNKFVTTPTDLSVVGPTDKVASMTLITCDPPGTSTNRLILQAEQIFPDPAQNSASSVQQGTGSATELPSASVTLWQRIKDWF